LAPGSSSLLPGPTSTELVSVGSGERARRYLVHLGRAPQPLSRPEAKFGCFSAISARRSDDRSWLLGCFGRHFAPRGGGFGKCAPLIVALDAGAPGEGASGTAPLPGRGGRGERLFESSGRIACWPGANR